MELLFRNTLNKFMHSFRIALRKHLLHNKAILQSSVKIVWSEHGKFLSCSTINGKTTQRTQARDLTVEVFIFNTDLAFLAFLYIEGF